MERSPRPRVRLGPQRLELAGGDDAALGPGGQPALQDLLVVVGELAVPRCQPGQNQIRHVDTGDQQQSGDGAQQQPGHA